MSKKKVHPLKTLETLNNMRAASKGKPKGSIWKGGTIKYERGGFTDQEAKIKGPLWTSEKQRIADLENNMLLIKKSEEDSMPHPGRTKKNSIADLKSRRKKTKKNELSTHEKPVSKSDFKTILGNIKKRF